MLTTQEFGITQILSRWAPWLHKVSLSSLYFKAKLCSWLGLWPQTPWDAWFKPYWSLESSRSKCRESGSRGASKPFLTAFFSLSARDRAVSLDRTKGLDIKLLELTKAITKLKKPWPLDLWEVKFSSRGPIPSQSSLGCCWRALLGARVLGWTFQVVKRPQYPEREVRFPC